MDKSQLRVINISGKGLKNQLLISSKEVSTLHAFLKDVIKNEVLIINTNLGLHIYYYSFYNQATITVNTFLLLATCKGKSINNFFVKSLNSDVEIADETHAFFERLVKNPLLFKSYSKSFCNQLHLKYPNNSKIINHLLSFWENELINVGYNKVMVDVFRSSLLNLRGYNFENTYQPILQKLVHESLSDSRIN